MIESHAGRHTVHLSVKSLLANLAHPPFSDRRFWSAQAMVAAIFVVHLGGDLAREHAMTPIPGFVWILLLFVPIIYAGMAFGLVGSLGAALTGIVLMAPLEILLPHSPTELWEAWATLVIVFVTAVMLGASFEETRAAAESMAAAEVLAKSEEGFRLAFEYNMAPMAVATLEAEVLQANRAFCEMLGRSRQELTGVNFMDYTHPDDLGTTHRINAQLARGEADQLSYTKRFLRKDGGVVIAEVARSLARDKSGAPAFVISSLRDITEERTLSAQLSHLALHDPLTGLPNRVLFADRLPRALQRGLHNAGMTALFLLDVDDLKGVNETLGHQVGDQLIQALARRLENVAGPTDTLARFTGDTFAYLADGLGGSGEAMALAKRLLGVLDEPFVLAGAEVKISASLGAVLCEGTEQMSADALLRNADTALHEAKRRGKSQMALFDPEMASRTSKSFQLGQHLSKAVARGEISMHYQPIVHLARGEIVGYEALMRWQHPEHGPVPPDAFIPLAEQSDLIVELGRFALGQATAQASGLDSSGGGSAAPYVAVNLSARQFRDPNLIATIEEALASSRLAPERLVLEITESIALADIESAIRIIEHLQRLRASVALDDFGTGYSSLSYLAMLRPDIIKIDRSFVGSSHRSAFARRLLEAMVSLCHVLDVTVIAEGIETEEQLALLRQLGCELGQGFLFSAAVPAAELEGMRAKVLRSPALKTARPPS